MHVYRAGNGASPKEQCVNVDLENHSNYIVYFFVQEILLSQNTSSNEEVTFVVFVLR